MSNIIVNRDPFDRFAPCTMGDFLLPEFGLSFACIERPWNDNKGDIAGAAPHEASCIFPGVYDLVRHVRGDGSKVFALVNPELDVYYHKADIPKWKIATGRGRYLVLIHPANFVNQIVGCIAPGMKRVKMRNPSTAKVESAVSSSVAAVEDIMSVLKWIDGAHTIDIRQANAPALFH